MVSTFIAPRVKHAITFSLSLRRMRVPAVAKALRSFSSKESTLLPLSYLFSRKIDLDLPQEPDGHFSLALLTMVSIVVLRHHQANIRMIHSLKPIKT